MAYDRRLIEIALVRCNHQMAMTFKAPSSHLLPFPKEKEVMNSVGLGKVSIHESSRVTLRAQSIALEYKGTTYCCLSLYMERTNWH